MLCMFLKRKIRYTIQFFDNNQELTKEQFLKIKVFEEEDFLKNFNFNDKFLNFSYLGLNENLPNFNKVVLRLYDGIGTKLSEWHLKNAKISELYDKGEEFDSSGSHMFSGKLSYDDVDLFTGKKKIEQGSILIVKFADDSYLKFINHCFVNVLISGVQVKFNDFFGQQTTLVLIIASPGIDRIEDAIKTFKGEIM